jgi:hypothetical protein
MVYDDKGYGFADMNGELAIKTDYSSLRCFEEGLATAVPIKGHKVGVINFTGQFVVEPKFDWIGKFSEGLASYRLGSERGYIDRAGSVIIHLPSNVSAPGEFHEGLAEVFVGGAPRTLDDTVSRPDSTGGFINKTGEFVFKPQFSGQGPHEGFHEGLAAVGINYGLNERFGYIDRLGNFVIQPTFLVAMRDWPASVSSVK